MSTHNICFHGETRKILSGYMYRLLSGAMTAAQGLKNFHLSFNFLV